MSAPQITVAVPEDRGSVVDSLVAAFVADPVLRYLFPEGDTYPRLAAAFFGDLFDRRVHRGTIWTIEGGASVAIWEPPGTATEWPDTGLADQLPAGGLARVRGYEQAVHAALPADPFWYLGVLGTHPDHAGRRWGHAVMRAGLRRAAADGLPAMLETSNPGNVEVYRKAGWAVTGTFTDPLPTWILRYPA